MSAALATLQRQFLAHLQGADDGGLATYLLDDGIGTDTGLRIYSHAYRARLRETLENDHAQLGKYLGDALWEQMCDGYIAAYPSRYRSLRHFGGALPQFLREHPPFDAHLQIHEIAALERRLLDCFDAADADRVDRDALRSIPAPAWPRLCLRLHPSLQLHEVGCNSVEIWQALKAGLTPPLAVARNCVWLLWRDDTQISRFRSLPDEEHAALMHFMMGSDLGTFCESMARQHAAEQVPVLVLQYLHRWCDEGLVAMFVTQGQAHA